MSDGICVIVNREPCLESFCIQERNTGFRKEELAMK